MVKPESVNIAKNMVAQGKEAGEIWNFFSLFDPKALEFYWKIPRDNITGFIRELAMKLSLEQPIVDVGCGVRSYKPEVAEVLGNNVRYVALDHFIRGGSDFETFRLPNLAGRAEALPILNESVGTVICSEVLEHVNDDQKVLSELSRILKKDGRLVLTLPGNGIPKHEKLPFQIDYRRYSVEEIQERLCYSGFSSIEINEKNLWGLQINILIVAKKS